MAEAILEQELEPILQENVARYTGKHIPDVGASWNIILNEVYPIIQSYLPSIFFQNPTAYLKPRNKTFIVKKRDPVSGKMVEVQVESNKSAKTQESLLNYDISQMGYKKETRKLLLDALMFPYGILWHGYKGNFGMTEERSITSRKQSVFVKRVSPTRFLWDPTVPISEIDEGDFVARVIDLPLRDVVEDKELNVDKKLKGFVGFGDKIGGSKDNKRTAGADELNTRFGLKKTLLSFADKDFQNSDGARFVRIYEVFLRPTKKEKQNGSDGKILLLTFDQEEPLRENEWMIKAEGFPAHVLEFNQLNDQRFGLDDIGTYKEIADQKNIIINQQIENAQQTGKVWVGLSKEGADEEDINAVQDGENTIVTFDTGNPRDRMFVASAGGQASSELYTLDGRIQQNMDNSSGVSDLRRGVLRSGEESATSVKIRATNGASRVLYRQDIMKDFLAGSYLYINQLQKQFVSTEDAVRIMGTLDIEWSENISKEDLQADVDVEIDVISMIPENPELELQNLNETLAQMVQALTIPDIKLKLQQEGKTINLSPIIEQVLLRQRIKDPNIFRNITPEESMGFVSVQQMREAQANVEAAITNQQIPFPPKEEDDHRAKLEVYASIANILKQQGQINQVLEMLMIQQQAIMQALAEKETTGGNKPISTKPSVRSV